MPLAITPTFSPWTHTSDDSYIYQLSLVLATAIVSFALTLVFYSLHHVILSFDLLNVVVRIYLDHGVDLLQLFTLYKLLPGTIL